MDERTSRTHAAAAEAPATPTDTERLRALIAASTPGPWATAPHDATTVMPKPWADSAVPPHPATTASFGMIQFTGPRNEADATLAAEALTVLPALLDELARLRHTIEQWEQRMWATVYERAAWEHDIGRHAGSDLPYAYCPRCEVEHPKGVRAALAGLFDLVVEATDAESYMREIGAPEIRAAAQALGLPVPEGVPEATPDTEGEG